MNPKSNRISRAEQPISAPSNRRSSRRRRRRRCRTTRCMKRPARARSIGSRSSRTLGSEDLDQGRRPRPRRQRSGDGTANEHTGRPQHSLHGGQSRPRSSEAGKGRIRPSSAGRRSAGNAVIDRFQQRGVERREIIGLPAGDRIAVDDDLVIDPLATGIADVGLHAGPGGEPLAAYASASTRVQAAWQIAATGLPDSTKLLMKATASLSIRSASGWPPRPAGPVRRSRRDARRRP